MQLSAKEAKEQEGKDKGEEEYPVEVEEEELVEEQEVALHQVLVVIKEAPQDLDQGLLADPEVAQLVDPEVA